MRSFLSLHGKGASFSSQVSVVVHTVFKTLKKGALFPFCLSWIEFPLHKGLDILWADVSKEAFRRRQGGKNWRACLSSCLFFQHTVVLLSCNELQSPSKEFKPLKSFWLRNISLHRADKSVNVIAADISNKEKLSLTRNRFSVFCPPLKRLVQGKWLQEEMKRWSSSGFSKPAAKNRS